MRVGVVGINHKLADLKLREQLAKACQKRFGAAQTIHLHHHFILLSTCNRTEVYFSSDDLAATHTYLLSILRGDVEEEFDHKLYSYFGVDCFSHLIRVTAGLDSAILAETEIQGQVKTAYEIALEFHSIPKELHFLFQKSLRIAKKIRSELQLGRGMPNLEHAILNTGKHFFKTIEETKILFIGASEINQKILSYLKTKNLSGITLCNRSEERAQEIAQVQNVNVIEWEYLTNWHQFDWIIFGTKAPEYLLTFQDIPQQGLSHKLIIDLAVPRNVEPRLSLHPKITLFNIDQMNRLLKMRNHSINQGLAQAETLILASVQKCLSNYRQKEQYRENFCAALA